jgi:hypothetical protein
LKAITDPRRKPITDWRVRNVDRLEPEMTSTASLGALVRPATHAEEPPDEQLANWAGAHMYRRLTLFRGHGGLWFPDNTPIGVTKACRNYPSLTQGT